MGNYFVVVVVSYFLFQSFQKKSFRKTIRASDTLDPDQAGHSIRHNLGLNCLQRFSAGKEFTESNKTKFIKKWTPSISFSKKLAIFQHLGCCLMYRCHLKAVSGK